jgi:hypothetical protein
VTDQDVWPGDVRGGEQLMQLGDDIAAGAGRRDDGGAAAAVTESAVVTAVRAPFFSTVVT